MDKSGGLLKGYGELTNQEVGNWNMEHTMP